MKQLARSAYPSNPGKERPGAEIPSTSTSRLSVPFGKGSSEGAAGRGICKERRGCENRSYSDRPCPGLSLSQREVAYDKKATIVIPPKKGELSLREAGGAEAISVRAGKDCFTAFTMTR